MYLTCSLSDRTAAGFSALKEEDSQYLRRRARVMETLEPLIDYLLRVSPEPSTLATVRNRFSSILMSTEVEAKQTSDNPFLHLVLDIIECGFEELQRSALPPQTLKWCVLVHSSDGISESF